MRSCIILLLFIGCTEPETAIIEADDSEKTMAEFPVLFEGAEDTLNIEIGHYALELEERLSLTMDSLTALGYEFNGVFSVGGPGATCDLLEDSETDGQLNGIDALRNDFNEDSGSTRIVTIVNPSCGACVKGQDFIAGLFDDAKSALSGFTVWISINGWGTREDAVAQSGKDNDPDITNYWDPEMELGKLFKTPLNMDPEYETAWDVYLIYEPGVLWDDESPPAPTFWMHQLGPYEAETGAPDSLRLDHEVFTENLVSTFDQR